MSGRPRIAVLAGLTDQNAGNDGERCYVGRAYMDCVLAAGGLPLAVAPGSPPADVHATTDGILMIGGPDIDPGEYGEEPHPASERVLPDRWRSERAIVGQRPAGMPVLGICYGCQALAVMAGGSLVQHLPDVLGHDRHSSGELEQIRVAEGSLLHQVVGTTQLEGKSYHHQAILNPGTGQKAVAWSGDVVEAIEGPNWELGVQWHAERTPDSPESKRLFRAFVQACETYRRERESCGTW